MISELLQKARQYEEKYSALISQEERPVYHLSPRVGWMNDPNGFSMYDGRYHLFYQYHPYTTQWGPMHWGHAVSTDLVRWEYLPVAIGPDMPYDKDGCFSGSAVELPDGRQLLVYTGVERVPGENGNMQDLQIQCLAVGDGLNYEKYAGNPVLTGKDVPAGFSVNDFRDPKIFRDADGSYGCVIGNRTDDGSGALLLFRSRDGFDWKFESILDRCSNEIGKMWECPDLLNVDGYDVILTSPQDMQAQGMEFHSGNGTIALLGQVRDSKFHRQHVQAIDQGIDFYAPQTLETPDGRKIMIAWMQNWDTTGGCPAGAKWFGQMTTARELTVRDGRLIQNPVRELEAHRANPVVYRDVAVHEEMSLEGISGRVLDMTITLKAADDKGFGMFRMKFAGDEKYHSSLTYRPEESSLRMSRTHAGFVRDFVHERECMVKAHEGQLKLRILLDRYSAEIFVNDGEQALTMTFYTPQSAQDIRFECSGNALMTVEKYELLG